VTSVTGCANCLINAYIGNGRAGITLIGKLRETCTHAELNGDWGLGDEASRRQDNNTARVSYISSTDQGGGKRRGWALRSITSEPGAK
jgi:hypothetical protein